MKDNERDLEAWLCLLTSDNQSKWESNNTIWWILNKEQNSLFQDKNNVK